MTVTFTTLLDPISSETVSVDSIIGGVFKAWVFFDHTIPSVTDDLNVSSMDDDAAGDWGLNFNTAMSNDDFAVMGGGLVRLSVNTGGDIVGFEVGSSFAKSTGAYNGGSTQCSSNGGNAGDIDEARTQTIVSGMLA